MSGDLMRSSSSVENMLSEKRDNMGHAIDPTEESSLPGVSGEPQMRPRVGDQYQAIVPDLIEGNECCQPNAEKISEGLTDRLAALPIPLMWAPNKSRDEERLRGVSAHSNPFAKEIQAVLDTESLESEQADDPADNQVKSLEISVEMDMMKLNSTSLEGTEKSVDKQEKNRYPLPGIPDEPWSDFECEAFILALYIFGKDLCLVKKFVKTKKMEDIISYYYGPFYKCKEYERWAKCLRSRSRKSIHGERMFTRSRQQELFSRLHCHISEETYNKVAEMSSTFKENGISFEEYVFTLKELIGTKLLIKVVAIGKGKQDLTGISTLPRKLNRNLSDHQEPQQDKGFSSLSCKEISEQLMSSRLSKNKSNDLFWEAVWPRLLAGGWHSEQPKDHAVSTAKHNLVFLMPGVAKFKRNKHVKGQHYFDSVSDVLNKVSLDPRLLELEDEKEKDIGHEESYIDGQELGLPNGKHNGYGKSCNSKPQNYKMEFMIVDTSKHRASKGSNVRWLESLPVHPTDVSTSSSACSGTGSDSSSEKSDVDVEETSTTISAKVANGISMQSNKKQDDIMDTNKRKAKKHLPWEKLKTGPSKYLSPLKRHQANAAGCEDLSQVIEKKKDKRLILCLPNPYKVKENMQPPNSLHIVHEKNLYPTNFSPKVNVENEYMECKSSKESEGVMEQSLPHAMIDLNTPQVPEVVATNHVGVHRPAYSSSMMENTSVALKRRNSCGSSSNTSPSRESTQQAQKVRCSDIENQELQQIHQQQQRQRQPQIQQEQEVDIGGRRQSTRNRPLTKKALEAFESSFIETTNKRKAIADHNTSRSQPRRRGNIKSNSTSDSGIGSNDLTSTRIEEDSATGNSENALAWLLPPPQVNLQLQLQ